MKLALALLDMSNLSACYFIGFIFSLRFFCLFQWIIDPLPVYVFIFIMNIFACHRIILAKRFVVEKVLQLFDVVNEEDEDNLDNLEGRRNLLEYRLQTETQLPEVAEFTYGALGRIIIEMSLAFLQWSMVVFHFQIITYSVTLLSLNFNETRPFGITHWHHLHGKNPGNWGYVFLGAAVVIFVSLSLMRTARQCGPFSLASLLCFSVVLGFMFYVIGSGSYKTIELPTYHGNITDLDQFSRVYLHNHRLLFTQVVGGILTVECSMVGTRHLALYPIFICGIVILGIGCYFTYGFGPPFNDTVLKMLLQINSSSVVNILVIVGIMGAFPLQNSPIYAVFEKRLLTIKNIRRRADTIQSSFESQPLLRMNLLYNSYQLPFFSSIRDDCLDVLKNEDVAADLETHAPWTLRYALRATVVVTQVFAAFLFYKVDITFKVFCMLCLFSSRFLAYIFPIATHMRIKWTESSWPMRAFDFVGILFCICEALQAFFYFVLFDWNI